MKKIFVIFAILFSCDAFAYYTQTIPNQCGILNKNMHAVFTPNVHTCNQGYFLPANTDGCRPCPNDYVCDGGTFTFNERQSQGIVYKNITRQNIPYGCATNMPHEFVAQFNPNVININWNGADSADVIANNAGSVVYDGDIRTPVRAQNIPGKTFTGWLFVNPTNVN